MLRRSCTTINAITCALTPPSYGFAIKTAPKGADELVRQALHYQVQRQHEGAAAITSAVTKISAAPATIKLGGVVHATCFGVARQFTVPGGALPLHRRAKLRSRR